MEKFYLLVNILLAFIAISQALDVDGKDYSFIAKINKGTGSDCHAVLTNENEAISEYKCLLTTDKSKFTVYLSDGTTRKVTNVERHKPKYTQYGIVKLTLDSPVSGMKRPCTFGPTGGVPNYNCFIFGIRPDGGLKVTKMPALWWRSSDYYYYWTYWDKVAKLKAGNVGGSTIACTDSNGVSKSSGMAGYKYRGEFANGNQLYYYTYSFYYWSSDSFFNLSNECQNVKTPDWTS